MQFLLSIEAPVRNLATRKKSRHEEEGEEGGEQKERSVDIAFLRCTNRPRGDGVRCGANPCAALAKRLIFWSEDTEP